MSRVGGVWKAQSPSTDAREGGKKPAVMPDLTSSAGRFIWGMDTSKNTIVVATLKPGEEVPVIDRMRDEEGSVRHLVGGSRPGRAGTCYEAGPCGFELHRAGELTAIRVPTETEEAVRDRAALLSDRERAQQRITAMLLRHGRAWRLHERHRRT